MSTLTHACAAALKDVNTIFLIKNISWTYSKHIGEIVACVFLLKKGLEYILVASIQSCYRLHMWDKDLTSVFSLGCEKR